MGGLVAAAIAAVQEYRQRAFELLLYQAVLETPVGHAWLNLLEILCVEDSRTQCLAAYGAWFRALAARQQSWQAYLLEQILWADNPFSQQAQRSSVEALPTALVAAARHDLQRLQALYTCDTHQVGQWLQTICELPAPPVIWTLAQNPCLKLH